MRRRSPLGGAGAASSTVQPPEDQMSADEEVTLSKQRFHELTDEAHRQGWKIGWAAGASGITVEPDPWNPDMARRYSAYRPCLFADIDHGNCALRATADSPPPTAVQLRELVIIGNRLRADKRLLSDALRAIASAADGAVRHGTRASGPFLNIESIARNVLDNVDEN